MDTAHRVLIGALLFAIAFSATQNAVAAIYQWEWVDPGDPSQGKRPSSTLCPGGGVVYAIPYANLSSKDLTQAYLIGAALHEARFESSVLTNADLSHADLTGASFFAARLADADLTDAQVAGADFTYTTSRGFTPAQLYSTASYKAKDLSGIWLARNDLTGWDFTEQNLAGADLTRSALSETIFTDADVRGVDFWATIGLTAAQVNSTASYKARDLSGVSLNCHDLSGWDFAGQNLTRASFFSATLAGAEFTDAVVEFTSFQGTTSLGFTPSQLYSTASYKAKDLSGIYLACNDLSGWDFAGQNLTSAYFEEASLTATDFSQANLTGAGFVVATLTGTDLSQANLRGASFEVATLTGAGLSGANLTDAYFHRATVTNVDLSGADARGAHELDYSTSITANTILPDGTIDGLGLEGARTLVLRDDDGGPAREPIPITVDHFMMMGADGVLRMVFEADEWDSLISFEPGIPVELGGMLELTFAPDVDVAGQIGRRLRLFDWSGVEPTGAFEVASAYRWNLADLYTAGEVVLVPEPGTAALAAAASACLLVLLRRRNGRHPHGS